MTGESLLSGRFCVTVGSMDTQRLYSALCSLVMPSSPPGYGVGESIRIIEDILEAEGSKVDPKLRHYLENRSYQKALAYLRDPSTVPAFQP